MTKNNKVDSMTIEQGTNVLKAFTNVAFASEKVKGYDVDSMEESMKTLGAKTPVQGAIVSENLKTLEKISFAIFTTKDRYKQFIKE